MSAEQTEQETRWRVLREKLADVRLGGVSPPYVREVCDEVIAHCASLEQQVADITRQRDELSQQLTENADVGSRAIAGNRALIDAALAAAQLATAYRERAEAAESQLAEMAKERDAANQRYDLIERDLCSYIDAARDADAALVKMREQMALLRDEVNASAGSDPSWETNRELKRRWAGQLSALLDPQDQP